MTALLGIDAGTSRIKTVAYDTAGHRLEQASEPVRNYAPKPGQSEQDMTETYDRVAATIEQVCDCLDAEVGAVGVTGQGGGCWLIDEEGNPVRNAILWNDGRAADIIDTWREDGTYRAYFDRLGDGPFPGMAVPILSWLDANEPNALATARTAFACKDWIRFRLTDRIGSDHSDASLLHFAPQTGSFDRSIATLADVPALPTLEPTVHSPTTVVGAVTESAAAETGLPVGTPVVTGCMDVVATALGSGAANETIGSAIVGTTLQTQMLTREPAIVGPPVGYTLALGIDGMGLRAMGAMVGTGNLEWARTEIAGDATFEAVERTARSAPPGSGGVLYHPYLSEAGEKAPFVDPNARAQFIGVSSDHGRQHLVRAVYEGVALAVRDCCEHLPDSPSCVAVAGGGSHSPLWCELFAHCLDTEISVPAGDEPGARGAAMLAAVGTDTFPDVETAVGTFTSIDTYYRPDASLTGVYDALYEYYRTAVEAMGPVWETRSRTLERIHRETSARSDE